MQRTNSGRRSFLKASVPAAGAVIVAGGDVLAASGASTEFPEPSFGGASGMNRKVLVVFASKAGSTAEVAAFIGKRLSARGEAVDVRRASHVPALTGYDAVIVGSAIRAGQWLSEASGFVKKHKDDLASRKTAFFTVCMTLKEDTPQNRQSVADYLKPVRAILEPGKMGFFAGKMDYDKLALVPRLIVKAMKVPQGDFRNFDAIGTWTDAVHDEMLAG